MLVGRSVWSWGPDMRIAGGQGICAVDERSLAGRRVRGLGEGNEFLGWMATETGIVRHLLVVGRHGHLYSHPLSCMSFLASLYRVSVWRIRIEWG